MAPDNAPQPSPPPTAEPLAAATIARYAAEEVVVRTQSAADGFLVLADAWYPGWHATVDGERVPVYQAVALFRAVFVPAGEHEVRFYYESTFLRTGAVVTAVALLALLLGAFLLRRHR